jgi:hypothetical protein
MNNIIYYSPEGSDAYGDGQAWNPLKTRSAAQILARSLGNAYNYEEIPECTLEEIHKRDKRAKCW